MNRTAPSYSVAALALALTLALCAVPAYGLSMPVAVHVDPVPSHALMGGVDLYGLSATDAAAFIASGSAVPTLAPITAKGDGHRMRLSAMSAVYVDVSAILDQAYAATDTVTPFELTPAYAVKSSVVSGWTAKLAKKINHKAVNAKRRLSRKRLVVSKEKAGHKVIKSKTNGRIRTALASQIASPGITGAVVKVSLTTLRPRVTRKNIGKAILVRLSKFTITLYRGTKIEKRFRCATGMPGYATPTGKWKVLRKVKNPSWHNPGSAWGRGMPSVIGPGPNNPLGTRALYLNASGIRIHGTPNWRSIGHRASHGCLRMRRRDVENLYPRVPVGTAVWITK